MRGIAYIITNEQGTKHQRVFEDLCNLSIKHARKHLKLPVALASFASSKNVSAEYHINAKPFVSSYSRSVAGLTAAEIIKTHICEWSPFEETLYLDCDAFVMDKSAIDFLDVLDLGYSLSLCTCVTQAWKDSIGQAKHILSSIGGIPKFFPYWNFGVFGVNKSKGRPLMERIRKHFVSYCFSKKSFSSKGGSLMLSMPYPEQL